MKKIIYGLIVLIGGVLIASNFVVDSTKLDHKTVSASGTACKWISESGYGIGPMYIEEGKTNISSINSKGYIYLYGTSDTKYTENIFNLFPCTSSNSSIDEKDGNLLYNADGSLFNGYFGFHARYLSGSTIDYRVAVNVSNGILNKYGVSGTTWQEVRTTTLTYNGSFFNDIHFIPNLGIDYSVPSQLVNYDYDYSSDGIDGMTFTCVCAEY